MSSCPGPKQPFGSGTLTSCTPLGTDAFVQRQLELKRVEHDHLLTGIPAIADLFFSRANCLLQVLPPASTSQYAAEHDFVDSPLPPAAVRASCNVVGSACGRWSEEAACFIRKAFSAPASLRQACGLGPCWSGMLAVATQRAFAGWLCTRWLTAPEPSRLPARLA